MLNTPAELRKNFELFVKYIKLKKTQGPIILNGEEIDLEAIIRFLEWELEYN